MSNSNGETHHCRRYVLGFRLTTLLREEVGERPANYQELVFLMPA